MTSRKRDLERSDAESRVVLEYPESKAHLAADLEARLWDESGRTDSTLIKALCASVQVPFHSEFVVDMIVMVESLATQNVSRHMIVERLLEKMGPESDENPESWMERLTDRVEREEYDVDSVRTTHLNRKEATNRLSFGNLFAAGASATLGSSCSRAEETRAIVEIRQDIRGGSLVDGIVLAGVHSWGGDVLESVSCRSLLPVALRPLISYGVDWLRPGLVGSPCIVANSETLALQKRDVGAGRSSTEGLDYYEDRMPRGSAGCVRDAAENMSGDAIVVVEGTIVPSFDLSALVGAHFRGQADLTVAVEEVDGHRRDRNIKPAGVYVFSRAALSEVTPAGYQDIKEALIPKLYAADRRVVIYPVPPASALRVTDAESYLDVNMAVVSRMATSGQGPKAFFRIGSAWVHESTTIEPGAQLKGPLLIGPACRVSAGALLIGPTVLGRGCAIDRGAVVTRSVLWDRCSVGRGAILDHSILTSGAAVDPEVVARKAVFVAS